jgi:hypothetical protein
LIGFLSKKHKTRNATTRVPKKITGITLSTDSSYQIFASYNFSSNAAGLNTNVLENVSIIIFLWKVKFNRMIGFSNNILIFSLSLKTERDYLKKKKPMTQPEEKRPT